MSERFREIRDVEFNESMEAFGRRIGISKNRVNDIENAPGGVIGVSRETINNLARQLQVTPAVLLKRIGAPADPRRVIDQNNDDEPDDPRDGDAPAAPVTKPKPNPPGTGGGAEEESTENPTTGKKPAKYREAAKPKRKRPGET